MTLHMFGSADACYPSAVSVANSKTFPTTPVFVGSHLTVGKPRELLRAPHYIAVIN